MSYNCACHDDKPPAKEWKRFVPVIMGAAIVMVLIAGAMLKDRGKTTTPGEPRSAQISFAARY